MLSLFKVFMSKDVLEPINNILMSGYVAQGESVSIFEKKLIDFIGNKYILTVNSATSGLTLATRLLIKPDKSINWPGIDKDDIVLTPSLTCFATTCSILANNIKIRWLDTDLNNVNICLNDLKKKLNKKTKIIYLVHWGGYPVDLDELDKICEDHKKTYGFKPMVVEDCAHSFGAEYNNKKIGNSNNICVFSFQAIKHLTTGDGGIITLPNKKLYDRCKLLRWFGKDRDKRKFKNNDNRLEHDIKEFGYKFHMNNINASIGINNLPHIENILKTNRKNAKYFDENLKNIKGIKLLQQNNKCKSAYWLYSIWVEKKEDFLSFMKEKNIMCSQVHQRNDVHSCLKEYKEELPNIDIIEKHLLCIPVGWWITKKDREYIVKCIKEFYKAK